MFAYFKNDKRAPLVLAVFLSFVAVWWPLIHFGHMDNEHHILDWFAGTYGIVAVLGSIWGLRIAKKWGGWSSVVGRCIQMFALGLLLQEFGQLVYAYYAIVKDIEVPYPSLGDIGFFGSVIFYIYGSVLLAKASGVRVSLRKDSSKFTALIIPVAILALSYMLFLRDYSFDWQHPIAVLLDFGYPFGQALYIAIAVLAFVLSRKLLGGVMHNKIVFIIVALCAQYAADFNFLFQASRDTYQTAQYGDVLYLLSYTIMTLALLNISTHTLTHKAAPVDTPPSEPPTPLSEDIAPPSELETPPEAPAAQAEVQSPETSSTGNEEK